MGVLADLVPFSTPAWFGLGYEMDVTEGTSWVWPVVFTDSDDDPMDLSGVTATAGVLTPDFGTVVIPLDTDVTGGTVTVSAADADTVNTSANAVVAGNVPTKRLCRWYLTLTDGTDTVAIWMPDNSPFSIHRSNNGGV